uniref:Uncharacterized protein n=1 Tax=Glossina austeni TaxID=7395 RepID=A0A1A9VW76_GLOAU
MAAETGGIKRKLPTGGEAYGIPRYASTGSKWRPSNCTITPDKAPLRVWIMRDESCAGNNCGSIQNTCNENPEEVCITNNTLNNLLELIQRISTITKEQQFFNSSVLRDSCGNPRI